MRSPRPREEALACPPARGLGSQLKRAPRERQQQLLRREAEEEAVGPYGRVSPLVLSFSFTLTLLPREAWAEPPWRRRDPPSKKKMEAFGAEEAVRQTAPPRGVRIEEPLVPSPSLERRGADGEGERMASPQLCTGCAPPAGGGGPLEEVHMEEEVPEAPGAGAATPRGTPRGRAPRRAPRRLGRQAQTQRPRRAPSAR